MASSRSTQSPTCVRCALVRSARSSAKERRERRRPCSRFCPAIMRLPLQAVGAELVGNYALQIEWSDSHGSGIYSFQYLREISPQQTPTPAADFGENKNT